MPGSVMNQTTDTARPLWSLRIAASALSRCPVANSHWHYKEGLLYKGILHLWTLTGEPRYWQSLKSYVDRYVTADGEIATYSLDEYNIDQINPGKLLFPIYAADRDERYQKAIRLLRAQLHSHPRTHEGGFWHKKIYPYQMWLDGIYMGAPFYAEYAATFDEGADALAAFDDLAFQITSIERHTRDPQTGLLYHGWDESRQQRWADPITGCSPHFWSRAIGWYGMAIVDVLDHFPADHPARDGLIAILRRTLAAVADFQDEATGLWWQILNYSQRSGNYLEASGSSMVVYAIAKAVRRGYLESHWLEIATKAFDGLIKHMVTIDSAGQVDLHGVCTSAGLGGDPYRDGSFEYYISEPVATNDLHGVGAFLLAATEMEFALMRRAE